VEPYVRSSEATSPGTVVLGASYRALGVVRSLGRRGVPVRVVRSDDHLLAAVSRYARDSVWRQVHEAELVRLLQRIADREGLLGAVLIPTGEDEARLVSSHHAALAEGFRLSVLPWSDIAWAYDKRETYRLARRLGLDCPETWLPAGAAELSRLELRFPVIVKPAFRPGAIASSSPKAWPARDLPELEDCYRKAATIMPAERLMVQELVPGAPDSQLAYGALCRAGTVVASIAAQRARQRPMDFGQASTFVETIEETELAEPAERLLNATGYTGLIEIEFKRSARDGRLKLLDVNPRTWGWQSVGTRAGVDFPYLLWRMLTDRPVARARGRPGTRWVRLTTDLPTAVGEVVGGRLSIRAYAASLRPPIEPAVLAADDPLPALFEPAALAAVAIRRAWRTSSARRRRPRETLTNAADADESGSPLNMGVRSRRC
jgi:predicted ATP-grasp superfamily ATP-dependent carboligase